MKEGIKVILKGEFVDMNTYVQAERSNRYKGAAIKKSETERVWADIRKLKLGMIKHPVYIDFLWYTKDLKKDADNISFSKKFILDGMVMAHLLQNDTRKFILGFRDDFAVDRKAPRVEILLWQ